MAGVRSHRSTPATQRGPVDIVQWQMSKTQKLSNRKKQKRKIVESQKEKRDNL
jgi:hypothetical protein